jgi:tRNA pseudouridine55 synthase
MMSLYYITMFYLFKSIITTSLPTKCQAFVIRPSYYYHHHFAASTFTQTSQFHSSTIWNNHHQLSFSSLPSSIDEKEAQEQHHPEPLVHLEEGLCAIYKPINWTSQDVVSCIRGMLERDAKSRGVTLAKRRSRRSKNKIKVGHGGTLDPLAEGVLVIGIGSGTKILTHYLSGSKSYEAGGKFGFETNTLDLEGNVTKTADFEHITHELVEESLGKFVGKIDQIPPIFSAIRKNGKRLYEQAREGKSEDDVEIDSREVEVHELKYIPNEDDGLPSFNLSVQCGGGTYIRSLIRDIGYDLDSVATMTRLVRTKQGPFTLNDAIHREDWSPETIYAAVATNNLRLSEASEQEDLEYTEQPDCAS